MHLAERELIEFASCVSTAEMHYRADRRDKAIPSGLDAPRARLQTRSTFAPPSGFRVSSDGTDVTAAVNGDHEWDDDSPAACGACGHREELHGGAALIRKRRGASGRPAPLSWSLREQAHAVFGRRDVHALARRAGPG